MRNVFHNGLFFINLCETFFLRTCNFSNSDFGAEKDELRRRVSDLEKQLEEAKKSTPAASGAAPAALSSGAAGAGGAKKKSVKFALEPETTVIGEDAAEKVIRKKTTFIWGQECFDL